MCAIVGALLFNMNSAIDVQSVNATLNSISFRSQERGRDGFGYTVNRVGWPQEQMPFYIESTGKDVTRSDSPRKRDIPFLNEDSLAGTFIANLRAEPTTEYVKDKQEYDQQPYQLKGWSVVHNGTIANDKELRTNELTTRIDSAAIVEALAAETTGTSEGELRAAFGRVINKLKGSFAILATHNSRPNAMFYAVNYRPLWYVSSRFGIFFASSRGYFPTELGAPQMIEPYTMGMMCLEDGKLRNASRPLFKRANKKALVVCSGGMDSVVAATVAQRWNELDVTLIHFMYGSRAEGPEVKAVKAVGQYLGVPVVLFPLPVYKPGDSPLLDANAKVAGGEEGAEFAHEWVPARNLLLLSVATAYAEANGFTRLILGNNLEEAGAYPDNEPEFISRFNDLLPFAVGDGKELLVEMPVGNLMKHEIVKLGLEVGAPLHLTWSCYRAGEQHCGTCGPCFMRRTAFEINNKGEVIEYAQ